MFIKMRSGQPCSTLQQCVVFELIIILLDIGMGNILSIISNVIITGAFLYLYLSGESKPQHIKKAITIVSAAILLIRIVGIIA